MNALQGISFAPYHWGTLEKLLYFLHGHHALDTVSSPDGCCSKFHTRILQGKDITTATSFPSFAAAVRRVPALRADDFYLIAIEGGTTRERALQIQQYWQLKITTCNARHFAIVEISLRGATESPKQRQVRH
jgi:hypothetical protein